MEAQRYPDDFDGIIARGASARLERYGDRLELEPAGAEVYAHPSGDAGCDRQGCR